MVRFISIISLIIAKVASIFTMLNNTFFFQNKHLCKCSLLPERVSTKYQLQLRAYICESKPYIFMF